MSKRCKLQKEYYKEFGNYKGSGKYTDHYVNWLESKVLAINYTHCCTEFICHSCNEKKSGQNDDQLHEVCKECFSGI